MKHYQITGAVLVLLAGLTSAATLQMQVVGSDITGIADNDRLWDNGSATPIAWADRTGNGNDASSVYSYWTPRYQEGEAGIFNQQDYVSRIVVDDLMGPCTFSDWDFTGIIVGHFTSAGAIMCFGDSGSGTGYTFLTLDSSGNITMGIRNYNYGAATISTTDTNYLGADHVFAVNYRANDDFELFVDGQSVLEYSGTAGRMDPTTLNRYGLGNYASQLSDNGSDGLIAEARIYTGSWADGEMSAVTSALASTYGIVPEPTTMALLLAGGAMAYRRRKL